MIAHWIIGLTVSLLLGCVAVEVFIRVVRGTRDPTNKSPVGVPRRLTGTIERVFFTVIVAADVSGIPMAMVGWIAIKMATNWNRQDPTDPAVHAGGITALLAGLLSMLFAFLGGWICSGRLHVGV